ncbi:MAG: flavocytochrome c [Lachnospiraceae bacterium]|nr:flavocytochrome c [Lachnospiraceae bacterium]
MKKLFSKSLNLPGFLVICALTAALIFGANAYYTKHLKGPDGTVVTASADGFGEGVTVTLTLDDAGTILAASVDAPNETPEIGGAAAKELADQLVAAGSAQIDGVAGATMTSDAVRKAAGELLGAPVADEAATEAAADDAAATEAAAEGAEAATEAVADAEAAPAEGNVVSASAAGFGDGVTVTLTLDDNGAILDASVDAPNETPTIGGAAAEELAAQLVAAQSADIDGVAGATMTSDAVRKAAGELLSGGADEEAAPATADGNLYNPGTYTGTGIGFGGEITAEVTVSENAIESVVLTGDKETVNIGSFAVEMLDDAILDAQTPKVDALTGATVTSRAIFRAVNGALEAAGANIDALPSAESVEIASEDKIAEERATQIVIVGAGGAGMTAAIRAKQAGADVLIVEKMPYAGGNTTKATGGMNAAETSYQEAEGIEDSIQQFIEDTMKGGHDINDIDLVTKMATESAACIDWLASIDAPLPKVSFSGGATNARIHSPEDGSGVGAYLVTAFLKQLDELGIEVMYNTTATSILMEDGKAAGITAEDNVTRYTIKADAVILATGGFGSNNEMIVSYRPDLDGTVTTNTPGATGDGIIMAEAIGAATVDIDQIQLHPTVEQGTSMLITEGVRGDGAILVNQSGERFTNELLTRDAVSAAELEQEGSYAYIIFDQNLRDGLKAIEKYVDTNITVQGDTIEELAEQINIDPAVLAKTLADWNEIVANQDDTQFGRTTGMEHDLSVAPYYAIKIAPGIHHTMGGLKINTETQVLDTEGNIISGLFAAGEVTGGVHGGNRIGGNAVADIVVFGSTAGNNAVAYINGEEIAAEAVTESASEAA